MKSESLERLYFIGAGGIGMANLVRYYLAKGLPVAGYDRTPSPLTGELQHEGAVLVFDDDPAMIPEEFRDPETTLVVFTPAVPESNGIFRWFAQNGFQMIKRAALLGMITRESKGICVAGSHGKTTTSSMIANILRQAPQGCNAFLGGILRNVGSNLVLTQGSEFSVVEADEYDRSFHRLTPWLGVVTSTDPDHLDIYGDEAGYLEAFSIFTNLIRPGGALVMHTGLKFQPDVKAGVKIYTYSGKPSDPNLEEADFRVTAINYGEGTLSFDLEGPQGWKMRGIRLGVPVEINVDNAVAAAAACRIAGVADDDIRHGLESFRGAKRRFEIHLDGTQKGGKILIDDYAHSPAEVEASIRSVRKLYPGHEITVIFQPHLYTRTRDFASEFAEALSAADRVIMPEIYPARELPIPGVTSELILNGVKAPNKEICLRKDLLERIKSSNFDILMTLGAADIDLLLPDIKSILENQ